MSTNTQPSVFFNAPIVYLDDYDAVKRVVDKMTTVKEFIVIADSGTKTPPNIVKLGKERNVQVIRIRSSGSWNSLYRRMAEIEKDRYNKVGYLEARDVMFLSFHSAHDISAGLKRHRTFNRLTCRELFYLNNVDDDYFPDEAFEKALAAMPNVATGVMYGDLNIEQRFKLSGFEFCRYLRPVHCPQSLEMLFNNVPFYEVDPDKVKDQVAA